METNAKPITDNRKIDENYFNDIPEDMLEYLTNEGLKNIELFTDIYHANRERAIKLATLLASGCGACSVLAIESVYGLWFLSLSVAWGCCALLLVAFCIKTRPRSMQYSDPYSLYTNEPNLNLLKRKRLYDYSLVFKQIQSLGTFIGEWFNRILVWSVVSPIIVAVVLAMRCLALKGF